MIKLTGYSVKEELFAGQNSIVYRGIRHADARPVVIKVLNQDYPSEEQLSSFKREFEIAAKASGDGTLEIYELVRYRNSLAIVMEDIGGVSLAQTVSSSSLSSSPSIPSSVPLSLSEKLSLSVMMARSLSSIHRKHILHKNINPSNIIWNRTSGRLAIIDFGIASELKRQTTPRMQYGLMEGAPEYLSPEQTGRVNRPVDKRSDLYSLGVTLYELFTGQLPFSGEDENELIYSHIARKPEPPHLVNGNIPEMVSNILLKLLAKDGQDRYQTASGLEKDLVLCLENVLFAGDVPPFDIGMFDISDHLTISDKLYGRQEELEKLVMLLEGVADGNASLVLIEGNPGTGKTSLVHEFGNRVSLRKGLFISGRFDQPELNIPLQGILQALRCLIQWLFSLPEKRLRDWREKILEAVPQNAGFLIELLPELEMIIGVQPKVVSLNPVEARNRFLLVISDFLQVFASADSPLVIFLDDLQWSDSTTFELMKFIMGGRNSSHIMFIGAYRQNELNAGHPLLGAGEEINGMSHSVQKISLGPLEIPEIDQMLADTFHRPPDEDTLRLANLIFLKTGGTPFFINQLLESLFGQDYFELSADQGKWVWDLNRIKDVDISDNVIDLLSRKVDELPPSALNILKIASCIGNPFDLERIAMISKCSTADIGNRLWPAVNNEIIFPIDQNDRLLLTENPSSPSAVTVRYAFQHNRIQQLIYSRIPEKERQALHLEIGRTYAQQMKSREDPDTLFTVVNHMNRGRFLIQDPSERYLLRDLNDLAGTRAMKSTAYSMAAEYFRVEESLLTKEEWDADPDALYRALFSLSNTLFLSGELGTAEDICGNLFALSDRTLDQAKAHNLKARILEFQGRIPEAIEEIRNGLRILDISLPDTEEDIGRRIGEGIMYLKRYLASDTVESLSDLPVMEDPNKIQAMELLFNIIPPALQFQPALYVLSALIMFELSREFGVTSFSCKSFVDIAITQCPTVFDFSVAYRLGKTSLRLLERLNAETMRPAVYFGFTFISFRNAPFEEAVHYYDLAYSSGLQTGDLQHAAYARAHKLHLFMQIGKNLPENEEETRAAIQFLREVKAGMPLLLALIIQYMLGKYRSEQEIDDDTEMLTTIQKSRNVAFLWRFFQYNEVFCCIHNQWKQAQEWSRLTDQFLFASQSDFPRAEHFLLKALILMRSWNDFSEEEKKEKAAVIDDIFEKMGKAALLSPSNFAHKYHFLAAEIAILRGAPQEQILDEYNKALASLREDDYIHMRALIYESMTLYWQHQGNEIIARSYITESYFFYRKWGALRKVRMMEEAIPNLRKISQALTPSPKYSGLTNESINIASIMKAIQAISGEIRIEKLLHSLMSLILENAGARQGALLLVNRDDKELYIEAEKKTFDDEISVMQSLPYRKSTSLCPEIIQYVARTRENIVLVNACKEGDFRNNSHIHNDQIKSVLAIPVIYQNRLVGVIYLEHDLAENVFTEEQIQILKILSSQASISIENARLYESLEKKVEERTVQLNQANKKLRQLSLQDPLTALHNRRYISEFVSELSMNFVLRKIQMQDHTQRHSTPISHKIMGVFMVDLDHFKIVNDTFGHNAGDQVLIAISRTLSKQIRADDFIVRWGGEEFLIILNNTDPEYLDDFARKILKAVEDTSIRINNETILHKTCSIGYCTMPLNLREPGLLNLEQTINISDFAMYKAKENGRNLAACICAKQESFTTPECKEYLRKLSKSDPIREDFIEVRYIENPKDT